MCRGNVVAMAEGVAMKKRVCGDCSHYAECVHTQNGLDELLGVCCVERDDQGTDGRVFYAEPTDRPEQVDCNYWEKREKGAA